MNESTKIWNFERHFWSCMRFKWEDFLNIYKFDSLLPFGIKEIEKLKNVSASLNFWIKTPMALLENIGPKPYHLFGLLIQILSTVIMLAWKSRQAKYTL